MTTHPLFEKYPLAGKQNTSLGPVPTPYHAYDGHGLLIGGTADLSAVAAHLEPQAVLPLRSSSGRALVGIWVVDFTHASLGPHHELQVSFLVSHNPVNQPVEDHPLALLKALFTNTRARMYCWKLWNNSPQVVAYNRELLGLDAQLSEGTITRKRERKIFRITTPGGDAVLSGQVREATRPSPRVGWALFRLLGLRQTLQALSQPYIGAKIVNPISDTVPYNGDAQSFVASDPPVVQFFDPASDRVTFGSHALQQLDFRPTFLEHFSPFRFVYLFPEKAAAP